MRATLGWLAALLLACVAAPAVRAEPWPLFRPQAPDTCGPGFYSTHPFGMVYGPNYNLQPAGLPFNGFVPPVPRNGGGNGNGNGLLNSPVFPTHPYAHSPRDYFMVMD
jgi:hypothetical protein